MSDVSSNPTLYLQQENARLHDDLAAMREQMANLRQVINALRDLQDAHGLITPDTEPFAILDAIMSAAFLCVNATAGSLALVDHDTQELVFVIVRGEASELANYRMPVTQGIGGWVATYNQPVRLKDVHGDPRFSPDVDQRYGYHTESLLCVPMEEEGRVVGVLYALNKANHQQFDADDQSLLMVVAQLAARALKKAENP